MFHPQTDGLSERKNQWIEQYLRTVTSASPEDWMQWLTLATAVHNNRKNATTGLSPNQILLGYEPQLTPKTSAPSNNDLVEEWIKKLMENRDQATNTINEAAKGNGAIPSQYHIGEQVWLEGKNLKFPHQATKLNPKCYGPFKIIKEISPLAYQLQLPPSWNIHPVFHASLLSPYRETTSHGPNFSQPPSDLIDNEEEYKVEQIKAHRNFGRSKRLQYLIKWKGYPKSNNTWENATDVHAPDLTKQYHKRRPLQKIKGRLLSLLCSSPFPLHMLSTTILNHPQSPFPYPRYRPNIRSPSIICRQQSSSDLCFAYTRGQRTSSTSSTLVGSTTMPRSSIPSFTGITARRSGVSITTNRSAWLQPSSFPQTPVRLTWMSRILSPSPLLTPHALQSSTSHSSILAYKHPPNFAKPPKCLQMALSIPPTPHPSKTVFLSRFAWSRVRNHLCRPVLLRPHWQRTLTLMSTSSEPLQKGSSQPSLGTTLKRTSKSIASRNKLAGSMIVSSTMKTYSNVPPTDTSKTMDESPTSSFPWATGSSNQQNGSKSSKTVESLGSTNSRARMSPLTLSTYMRRLTQLGTAKKTPLNRSLPGSVPSSLGQAATSCTSSATLATLTTRGWLGRSLASASSIKKPPSSPHGLKSCMKNSTQPATPEPYQRSDWSSPVHLKRRRDSKTS